MLKQEILSHFRFPAERILLIRHGVEMNHFKNQDLSDLLRTKVPAQGFRNDDAAIGLLVSFHKSDKKPC